MKISKQLISFMIVGATNNLMVLGIYQILLWWLPYWLSYSIAFGMGMIYSYVMNSRHSFKSKLSWDRLYYYSLFYLSCYVLGLTMMVIGVRVFGIGERWIPFIVVTLMFPLSFYGSRRVLSRV